MSGSPQPGSETGTSYTLTSGTYVVSESGGPSGYAFTGFSGDCDSSGNVTVVAGQTKTCTLTNNDIAPKLHLRQGRDERQRRHGDSGRLYADGQRHRLE